MSTNCIRCVKNKRTGLDLLCDECRNELRPEWKNLVGQNRAQQLEEFRRIRERGQCAIRVIEGGHRSENAIVDLLNYARQLKAANARHAIHHIKNTCAVCGHTTTEDGCANCLRIEFEARRG